MIDFLIIGGGIAGVSAAARLATLGSVTVLEQEDALAYHASGRSAAVYEDNYGAPAVVALNRASREGLEAADGGVLTPRGFLMLGNADNSARFDVDKAVMDQTEISVSEALTLCPVIDTSTVTRAAYHNTAKDIDTDRLVQHFVRLARSAGAQFKTRSAVSQITRTAKGWDVQAGQAVFQARQIVNAAGAWADQIAQMAGISPLGLTPYRRSMARIPAPAGYDVSDWPMIFGPGETWYAKPDAGALIVSPADETSVAPHDAYADELTLAEGLDRYGQHVTAPITRLLASWAGLRTFAPDRNLVIGPSHEDGDFLWCAGQGGYGIQTSFGASQLLSDLVSGAKSSLDASTITDTQAIRFS
ncbi:NAD(P)/FAD-dependent oxidoreductase [Yoonia sp. 208BN28-4]|uniref:NAD(P)/FAD-dependent oxidoreductase n=1 Tax=Yoonia sp. 208BN28-4 TaxID=3126505 RepID=UPI00309CB0AC